jgi:putative transposase
MAYKQRTGIPAATQSILTDDPDFLRLIVERVVQAVLDAEMTVHLHAEPYEHSPERRGYRNGYKPRTLNTRVGTLSLHVPQDRDGTFSTQLFARYQRNEKALVLALMEMYVEGVSTRKVHDITEVLCGTSFSKSLVSELAGQLDAELEAWRNRPLTETPYPYLRVDAATSMYAKAGRSSAKACSSSRACVRTGTGKSSQWWSLTRRAKRRTSSCFGISQRVASAACGW